MCFAGQHPLAFLARADDCHYDNERSQAIGRAALGCTPQKCCYNVAPPKTDGGGITTPYTLPSTLAVLRMPRSPQRTQPVSTALVLLALILGSIGSADAAPLRIVVSVVPLKTFVERIGGDRVHVDVMVPPGHSPATYDPSPRQVAALAEADLYVRVGVPFETAWMRRFQGANPTLSVLDLRDGITLRPMPTHHHEGHGKLADQTAPTEAGGTGDAMDSHIWTSPRLVRAMSRNIAERLTALDPTHAADYAANQRAFDAELAALDSWLTERLADLDDRRFLVFHPAWGYFAADYQLEQVPIEYEGKAPGARRLATLIDQARSAGIRVVFVQPQFDRRAPEQLARAIGGRVVAIDPLSADYIANLHRVADALVAADSDADDPRRSAE